MIDCEKLTETTHDPQEVAELLIEQNDPGWKEKIHETYYDSKEELEQKAIYSISSG